MHRVLDEPIKGRYVVTLLTIVARFEHAALAAEFAEMKNTKTPGAYVSTQDGGKFAVAHSENVALFLHKEAADEYVRFKNGAIPQQDPAQPIIEAPIDNDTIWAQAAAMAARG